MPFIPDDQRTSARGNPITLGQLTYKLYQTVVDYLDQQDMLGFHEFAEVLGCLEACKLELYRSVVAPYEQAKKMANGDVRPVGPGNGSWDYGDGTGDQEG